MSKVIFQLVEQFNEKEDKEFLLQVLVSLFLNVKRRLNLIIASAYISSIRERASRLIDEKPALQALLDMLNS